MAQGSKQKYTSKQKRKAHDIERDYKAWGQAAKKQNAADGRLQINHIVVVGKNASVPLMARASIEPMITTKTASNAVFSASERLLPSLIIIRVATKTITPRTETWRNVKFRGSVPIPSNV